MKTNYKELKLRIPKEENPYYKDNPQYFNELLDILMTSKNGYGKKLIHSKKYILNWIKSKTTVLNDEIYTNQTRVYWIIHGIIEIPTCQNSNCNKKLVGRNAFGLKIQDYPKFCNNKCQISSPFFKKMRVKTWKKNYGKNITSPSQIQEIRDKQIATCLKNNGVKWPMQSKKIFESGRDKKELLYGNRNYVNSEQAVKTYYNKTGYKCPMSNPNIYNKIDWKQQQNKIYISKKKNNSFKQSRTEDLAYQLLKFIFPNLQRQYNSSAYPFATDFYDPFQPNIRFEFQGSWTHGKHPFDSSSLNDLLILMKMLVKGTKYYQNAIQTWIFRDVQKREIAQKNSIILIEFWSLEEVRNYVIHYFDKNNMQKSK